MVSNFEFLIETLDRQIAPFCGQFNADGQDTVSISSQYLFLPILILLFSAEGMPKIVKRELGIQVSVLDC